MSFRWFLAFAVSLPLVASCGDSDEENSEDSTARAVAQCEALIDTFCEYETDCTGETLGACTRRLGANLDCSLVYSTSPNYDRCISDLQTATCGASGERTLPASCRGVFN